MRPHRNAMTRAKPIGGRPSHYGFERKAARVTIERDAIASETDTDPAPTEET